MKHSFIKNLLISGGVILATVGVAVFAQTNIDTNIFNAVQTIMRTVYTDDGSAGGNVLVDINNGSGIFIANEMLTGSRGYKILGLDLDNNIRIVPGNICSMIETVFACTIDPDGSQGLCPSVCINNGGVSISGSGDHDWYQVGTTQTPMDINDNIYTYGQVGIGMDNPTVPLQVSGNVIFGANIFGEPQNEIVNSKGSSILGGYANYIENITFGRNTIGGGGFNRIANNISGAEISYSFIGAGTQNRIIENTSQSFIGAGNSNTIAENQDGGVSDAAIVAGQGNYNATPAGFIGAGINNTLIGRSSSIVGGFENTINGQRSLIGGGVQNQIQGDHSFIGGGSYSQINGKHSFIGGGYINKITDNNTADWGSNIIGGGAQNTISGSQLSSILGGMQNKIYGWGILDNTDLDIPLSYGNNGDGTFTLEVSLNTILGGTNNEIENSQSSTMFGVQNYMYGNIASFVGGVENKVYNQSTEGYHNIVLGRQNTVTGGTNTSIGGGNEILGSANVSIGDGANLQGYENYTLGVANSSSGNHNISIGRQGIASGFYNYIFGVQNSTEGNNLLALGGNAHANGMNIGVINIAGYMAVNASQDNSFIINAPSGVGINHTAPSEALDVNGNIKTQGTFVAPSNNQGMTQTINLTDSQSNPCTLTVESGIITATTCQ